MHKITLAIRKIICEMNNTHTHKKKTLSYFNSTYQAFKKKRPVKTKNFPKLGDSVLPQSSCKAPNPAQALLRVRTQGLEVVGPWGPWNESHGARGSHQLRSLLLNNCYYLSIIIAND